MDSPVGWSIPLIVNTDARKTSKNRINRKIRQCIKVPAMAQQAKRHAPTKGNSARKNSKNHINRKGTSAEMARRTKQPVQAKGKRVRTYRIPMKDLDPVDTTRFNSKYGCHEKQYKSRSENKAPS